MDTLTITKRIRYAIRNTLAPTICTIRGHRTEQVEIGGQKFTLCTRCGEN